MEDFHTVSGHPTDLEHEGFHLVWPLDDGLPLCNRLLSHGWCVLHMVLDLTNAKLASRDAASRRDFEVLKQEFAVDLVGRNARCKVAYLESDTDAQGLGTYDDDITRLCMMLEPWSDLLGFSVCGRTPGMVRVPVARCGKWRPEALSEQDVEDKLVEEHLLFLQRRRLCVVYVVDGSVDVELHPRVNLTSVIPGSVQRTNTRFPLRHNTLLVFCCNEMSFEITETENSVLLQSWILDDPVELTMSSVSCQASQRMEVMGVLAGPRGCGDVQTTALAVSSGGWTNDAMEQLAMYSAGTDGHYYIPSVRFDTDLYFSRHAEEDWVPNRNSYHVHGAMCRDEDITCFDADFFGIAPEEASMMWPQQRTSLQTGYECLVRSGFTRKSLQGKSIGCYFGDCAGGAWESNLLSQVAQGNREFGRWWAAINVSVTCSRLSFVMGMKGPCSTMDTACSSGLSAFNFAHHELLRSSVGAPSARTNLEGAMTCGVNLTTAPDVYIANCTPHMLSVKGRCWTFDGGADGYARGEGTNCAYSTLNKGPFDFEKDIASTIGSRVNQDGRSASMYAPNGPAQQQCILASLREGAVAPSEVTVFECHGTGTALGDPIEVGALLGVQGTDHRVSPLCMTSAKSNIGHLEASAGTTGVIKCMLMLMQGVGSPNVHLRRLNPHINIDGFPAHFDQEFCHTGLNAGIAGVSSFGMGGTNAHCVVWAPVKFGSLRTGKVNEEALDQITVTCPITMGPIDHLTGEPALSTQDVERRKYVADVLREEFAPYDVSSLVYKGSYRFRLHPMENDVVQLDQGTTLHVCGSWAGWNQYEELEYDDATGCWFCYFVLGESCCEYFHLCLNKDPMLRVFPAVNKASPKIFVDGPCADGAGKNWIVDGRDEHVRQGTVFKILFRWGRCYKQVWWEETSRVAGLTHLHTYSVVGSWTGWSFRDMSHFDGRWTGCMQIGTSGAEEFQFVRDHDWMQAVHPARPKTMDIAIPARGPDELGHGKHWVVSGFPGEVVQLSLHIADAKVTLSVTQKSTKLWKSVTGWDRHEYFLVGSWTQWLCLRMHMDPSQPGVFKCHGQVLNEHGEFFYIVVDEDSHFKFYPQLDQASSGSCLVMGPDDHGTSCWMVRSDFPGACFEVAFDVRAEDRREVVTWRWTADETP